jgi:hypothetical protein
MNEYYYNNSHSKGFRRHIEPYETIKTKIHNPEVTSSTLVLATSKNQSLQVKNLEAFFDGKRYLFSTVAGLVKSLKSYSKYLKTTKYKPVGLAIYQAYMLYIVLLVFDNLA